MTDLANLRTASLYINNQLLSRGLLRDGRAIDFADPAGRQKGAKAGKEGSDGEKTADCTADTMARIISVVNDLILRRDRDAEHRESLSTALRTVRAESLHQANDLQRALERNADAQRRADLGEAAEASLRAQLAASEASNRKLREEAVKMRQLVAQTRSSCANEVRKRDRQIDGLKKAVSDAGRARGERRSPAITTITITGGEQSQQPRTGFASPSSVQATPTTNAATAASANATASSGYDLRTETNAFLADLARSLSHDNETLLDLVRHTSRRLKAMSGFVVAGTEGSDEAAQDTKATEISTVADCGALVTEMDGILEHLRTILTNPSFVPIEEVVQRESEISRLRDGWEKMEYRWKEAVHLLDGWRRRMALSGRPVNMEEIKMGLRLSPVRVRNVAETSQGLDMRLSPLEEEVQEEREEADIDDNDSHYGDGSVAADDEALPPLGRTPSPEEPLHLEPAPGAAVRERYYSQRAEHDDGDLLSESDSDISSVFVDDDEPNVQIIEQSMVMPSLEPSPVPEVFSRSTPSPSPPPPEKPALSKVTTAALKEKERDGQKGKELQPKGHAAKTAQPGLRPSHTAGNRGGVDGPTNTAAASETKKDTTVAVIRGRRRLGEAETGAAGPANNPKDTKQARTVPAAAADKATARPVAPRTVAPAPARNSSNRTTAPRPIPSRQEKPAVATATRTTTASRPAATAAAPMPSSAPSQDKQRPASASSQASEASTASSLASRKQPVPSAAPVSTVGVASTATLIRSRPARPDEKQSAEKTTTTATSANSSSEQMPPPPVPTVDHTTTTTSATTASSTATAVKRARSRSPLKIAATDVTSRLPLPTTSTAAAPASCNIPPASPALNMATIAAKLAASEREADAARVRAKLKAMRSGALGGVKGNAMQPTSASSSTLSTRAVSGGSDAAATSHPAATSAADPESGDPVKRRTAAVDLDAHKDEACLVSSVNSNKSSADQQPPQPLRKKREQKDSRRTSRVASRRRSTLNPWELKSLMAGGAEEITENTEPAH